MMRVEGIDRAKHYADELAKLRTALTRITDETATELRLFFFAEQVDTSSDPSILIGAHDREFGQILSLARACLRRDIAEIADTLRGMGVQPEI
jgi:hypothetical protein